MLAARRKGQARRASRTGRRGVTLLEVLVAIGLVALLSGSLLFGRNMLAGSRLKATATSIVSSVRYGIARANATGKPTRLVLDFDEKKLSLEEASSSVMLREKGRDPSAGATPATSAEARARLESERILEGPRPARPSFSKLRDVGGAAETLAAGRPLGDGVELVLVQTEHDEEPVTDGRGYVYFWPGGVTERAVIQLKKKGDRDAALSVVLSSLTGRARVEKGAIDFPQPRFGDEEFSERDEQ
jgi:general secretion pathway protein H